MAKVEFGAHKPGVIKGKKYVPYIAVKRDETVYLANFDCEFDDEQDAVDFCMAMHYILREADAKGKPWSNPLAKS